jgi:S1-C subfamily serine protease
MLGKWRRIPVLLTVIGLLLNVPAESQNTAPSSNMFGLTVEDIYDRGVIVTHVDLGSRAREIGIRRGDVILAVNGEPVLGRDEFQKLIPEFLGGPISFTISRFGQINIFVIDTRW